MYCNLKLIQREFNLIQLVLDSAARAVIKTTKFRHITLFLESLSWLETDERFKYKVLSLIYKYLKTGQPSFIRSLLSFPAHCSTRSPFLIVSPLVALLTALSIILLVMCGTVSHLIYVALLITSLLRLYTHRSLIFQPLFFLKRYEPIFCTVIFRLLFHLEIISLLSTPI